MSDALPPLNAVRAFVAAARHGSFTRAALALHVTHGAVSRQVKTLETHLGVALFERNVRHIRLTEAGRAFFVQAERALSRIASAAQALRSGSSAHAVRIDVRPSFAVRWLIPRLPGFVARHPGIEPEVVTRTGAPREAGSGYDVVIRRGTHGWPASLAARPFIEDEAYVVAAPSLLARQPVTTPRALTRCVWLSSKTRADDWPAWQAHLGLRRLRPARQIQFDHLHFVLQAAVDGLGVALAPHSLIGNDLSDARLVCPLPAMRLPLTPYCYGVTPRAGPAVDAFVAWLEAERRRSTPL